MSDGEPVIVEMSTNAPFPWCRAMRFEALLVHRPQGEGDTFRFNVPGVGDVEINGNAPALGFWPWRPDWRDALAQALPRS